MADNHHSEGETAKRRAIFLDRDGTLNEEAGYLNDPARLRLYEDAAAAVRLINEAGWLAVVLTNQSGIARGLLSEAALHEIHAALQVQLQQQGARLNAFYYCPHLPVQERRGDGASGRRGEELAQYFVDCACRKPLPGLIERAAQELHIDVARSFVIGDRYRDVAAGHAAGAQGVLVLTGYGHGELQQRAQWPRQPEYIAENLLEAVKTSLLT